MLRGCWPEPLIIAHAERLDDALSDIGGTPAGCIVIDVARPQYGWLDEVEQLRNDAADVPIVVLADNSDDESAIAALRVGAQDYLDKSLLSPRTLRRAIRHAIERKHAEVELAHRALHDSLTALPNRALFLDRLGVALDRARRSGASVAVLFLDVDNFKDINDSRGHSAGDHLLVELAERLRTMLRPMDTVARFGGDEFTFLFEDLADEREVVLIAERIAQACKTPIDLDRGEVTVTVSMGIAMVADPRTPADTVIREADIAMYRAKEKGGSRFELFDESTRDRALERLELEVALRRAIEERQLQVHYQPSVSLRESVAVTGLEALLRWQHPERGLIGAEEFITLAEETGLVLELGQYVLAEVLRPLAQWRLVRPDMTIGVNLSLRELEDIGLVSTLTAALRAADVAPDALCLEVTESAVARNPAVAGRVLRALKDMGVHTLIDDFGTGSSSVLAVDGIKLHESLLSELDSNGDGPPVVGAVVELAHALGLRVVAEGVETEAQAEELRALGCDGAQGFLFARPVPEEAVEGLLGPAELSGNTH
jgi:diguanylate cyclase (GGDEF)-like protein